MDQEGPLSEAAAGQPSVARIRGQIFAARVEFLRDRHGPESVHQIVQALQPADQELLRAVDREGWYPFAALMRVDRVICETLYGGDPVAYETLGAASAKHRTEWLGEHATLVNPHGFFARVAEQHRRFHDFGEAEYRRTAFTEGELSFSGYPEPDTVFCLSSIGYFRGVIEYLTRVPGIVDETECQCRRGRACRFRLRWMGSGKWRKAPEGQAL